MRVMETAPALTDLIRRAESGDAGALQSLFDAAYADLHRLARIRLGSNRSGALLDTTALVHESYLRFAEVGQLRLEDRQHFMRYSGHVMRSVIIDLVRAAQAERRGGDVRHVTLNSQIDDNTAGADEILRVHEAIDDLAQYDPRMVQVVEMRYFAGMTEAEIADALGVAERTVRRDWEKARVLLAEALR
ncbi:ECF-type sigma factor [Povalibacter sp.]|uniref:ECF-type sigma factor n=1 Tax=Povalibacter sp. TaxID=1962978 RepID=UPI002F3FD5A4